LEEPSRGSSRGDDLQGYVKKKCPRKIVIWIGMQRRVVSDPGPWRNATAAAAGRIIIESG
jgi:hypothetical protein